jgi:hypothetical protein
MKYVEQEYKDRARNFRSIIKEMKTYSANQAIERVLTAGYGYYLEKEHIDIGKVRILQILAKQEPDIKKFLLRLQELEKIMRQEFPIQCDNKVILSTIHTSKGMEYDAVYMVDVYEGRFPSNRPNIFSRSKDSADPAQEERRLFYVGITRAKNSLTFFNIEGKQSSFISELFPEEIERSVRNNNRIVEERKTFSQMVRREDVQSRFSHPTVKNNLLPKEGMRILHKGCGELKILEIKNSATKIIIRVEDANGTVSSMDWDFLISYKVIEIIS